MWRKDGCHLCMVTMLCEMDRIIFGTLRWIFLENIYFFSISGYSQWWKLFFKKHSWDKSFYFMDSVIISKGFFLSNSYLIQQNLNLSFAKKCFVKKYQPPSQKREGIHLCNVWLPCLSIKVLFISSVFLWLNW